MGLRIELRQSQTLKQELSVKQRLELRQEIAQRMGQDIAAVRNGSVGDEEELLSITIDELLKNIENEQVRAAMKEFLGDDGLRNNFLEAAQQLAIPTEKRIENFALNFFYDSHAGRFSFETGKKENEPIVYEIDKGKFNDAYQKPDYVKEEIKKLDLVVKSSPSSGVDATGTVAEIRRMNEALLVAESARQNVEMVKEALKLALLKNGSNSEPALLAGFLRDLAVIRKLDFVLSDRIQKRFANRFRGVLTKSSVDYEEAFLNTVGEYALISMGIVDPEIFRLQKAGIDPFLYRDVKGALGDLELNYEELAKYYNLKGSGTIFWNRWAIKGQKPSRITDDKIREFLTKTVRSDRDKLLAEADFKEFFENIKDVSRTTSRDNRENELRKLLMDKFEEEKFKQLLLDSIKNTWYAELDVFMNSQSK